MLKTQKYFSPLECGICKQGAGCPYKSNYAELYRYGFTIPIKNCQRLNRALKVKA